MNSNFSGTFAPPSSHFDSTQSYVSLTRPQACAARAGLASCFKKLKFMRTLKLERFIGLRKACGEIDPNLATFCIDRIRFAALLA